ncbi:MAG: S8 family serine peptidase [Paludibacter sp.]
MKKLIYITGILFFISTHLMGQDNYYWSNGKKNLMNAVEGKYVVKLGENKTDVSLSRQKISTNSKIKVVTTLRNNAEIINSEKLSLTEIKVQQGVVDAMPAYKIGNKTVYLTGEILIKPKQGISIEKVISIVGNNNVKIIKHTKYNTFVLAVSDWDKIFEYANIIYESGLVEYSHPNFTVPFQKIQTQTDPLYPQQYYLNNTGQNGGTVNVDINAPEAWNITTGNSTIRVAVIDDGVENHEDLQGRILTGRTMRFSTTNPDRQGAPNNNNPPSNILYGGPFGHGQACAGIIAATHNNMGVRGIAPQVNIVPINIFNDWFIAVDEFGRQFISYREDLQDYADAINAAWDDYNADVLSNSWGNSHPGAANAEGADAVVDAINRARTQGRNEKGSIVVFASGNEIGIITYNDNPFYEVVGDGLTSISIDFKMMGSMAADFVLNQQPIHCILPTNVIIRNSL